MLKVRSLATLLALSSVAVLPACSMFGGGDHGQARNAGYSNQNYAAAPQPMAPQATPMSQDTIQQVQQKLQQDGMYRARIDGVWGPATEAAVRSYQQQHNLTATGQLDADTMASLNMGGNQNYGNAQQPTEQRYGSNYNPNNNNTTDNNPPNNNAQPTNMSQSNNANQPAASTTR